ncbi:MAG: MBL fold metallo-hydrolase [Candidatus Parvarchaeota archaeon]|nr:MBL fold metallo-hydrolase [Candidatus Parvarchaeota archaeon]
MTEKTLGVKINDVLHEINLGYVKVFLIEGKNGLILIDTGMPNSEKKIIAYINSIGKSVSDIKYILLTHSHVDHFGSAYALQKMSNAHIGISESGLPYVDGSRGFLMPVSGSKSLKNRFFVKIIPIMLKFMKPRFVKPDMKLKEGVFPKEMGINAKIIETPGHTRDSISIYLVDSKTAIVGDLLQGTDKRLESPPFFEDYISIINSINKIKELKPDLICVSHGKDHSADDIFV